MLHSQLYCAAEKRSGFYLSFCQNDRLKAAAAPFRKFILLSSAYKYTFYIIARSVRNVKGFPKKSAFCII